MTFFEFNSRFPTEQAAINFFYKTRYNGVLTCPHCGSKAGLYRASRQKVCICHSCNNTLQVYAQEGMAVISDDFSSYKILDKETANKYLHFSVNHSLGQYSAGNGIHTNGIEGFWSLMKREYVGTHHHYSVKYMQHYIDEMSFRQNNWSNPAVFGTLLRQAMMRKAA